MRFSMFASLWLALGCAACGARMQSGKFSVGDAEGAPRLDALPSLDVAASALSKELHSAEDLSNESLSFALPEAALGAGSHKHWTDVALRAWLGEKQRRAESARAALELAAVQNPRQRVVVGALVGLVFEETAKSLLQVPAPEDLPLQPEVVVVFREIMQKNASVCMRQAKLGYDACTESAAGVQGMAHWAPFCDRRAKNLPEVHDPLAE